MMKIVVRCQDVLDGPPTTWVSPCVSPFPIPLYPPFPPLSEFELPTSLWKGEGQMQWGPHILNVLCLDLSPHPSIEGRGSLGVCMWLEANWRWRR